MRGPSKCDGRCKSGRETPSQENSVSWSNFVSDLHILSTLVSICPFYGSIIISKNHDSLCFVEVLCLKVTIVFDALPY